MEKSPSPVPGQPPATPVSPSLPPRRHHRLRWTILSLVGVLVIILGTAGWLFYRAISVVNTKKLDGTNTKVSFFQQLTHLVTSNNQQLQGEREDRVNILLLGIGGPGHDGPYLTDTMIVASVQPSTGKVALLSIPRDLVVDIPGYDYRKINNVLSFGRDQKYPGGGEALTVKVVSDLLNIPIQYYARVDFTAFEEVVDDVGGVDITVRKAFTDSSYPTNNYGYQTVSFKAGLQHMNGKVALEYARSRHGSNGENSDFARSRRQQQLILALKDKLLSLGTLANPKKISDILGSIGTHSQTNMEVWEMVRLAKLAQDVSNDSIINKVIDSGINGLLKNATGQNGAFILVPVAPSYDDIRFLAQNIFLIDQAEREGATVAVANATSFTGIADTTTKVLSAYGLTTAKAISVNDTTTGSTVILDTSNGRFPKTVKLLELYKRAHGTLDLTDWETQTGDTVLPKLLQPALPDTNANTSTTKTPDLILILGQDQPKTVVRTLPNFSFRSMVAPLALTPLG